MPFAKMHWPEGPETVQSKTLTDLCGVTLPWNAQAAFEPERLPFESSVKAAWSLPSLWPVTPVYVPAIAARLADCSYAGSYEAENVRDPVLSATVNCSELRCT